MARRESPNTTLCALGKRGPAKETPSSPQLFRIGPFIYILFSFFLFDFSAALTTTSQHSNTFWGRFTVHTRNPFLEVVSSGVLHPILAEDAP